MKRIILIIGLSVGFSVVSGMLFVGCGKHTLRSFKGKVVDAETKEPIEGAVVLAVYFDEAISPAGSSSFEIDAQETLTDANGEFEIPSKKVKLEGVWWEPDCNLLIFKPGYGVFPKHKLSNAVGENKSWPPPDKYIVYEIPKLETREEMRSNIPVRPDIPYEKMKLLFRLINEERINVGLSPLTLPKEERQ